MQGVQDGDGLRHMPNNIAQVLSIDQVPAHRMLSQAGSSQACCILSLPGTGHLPCLGLKLCVMGRPRQVRHAVSFPDRLHYITFEGQAPALHDFRPLSSMLLSMLHVGEAMRVN